MTKVGATGREIVYVACRCEGGGYTLCRLFLPCRRLRQQRAERQHRFFLYRLRDDVREIAVDTEFPFEQPIDQPLVGVDVRRHAGILKGEIEAEPTKWLDMPSDDCFAFAEDGGLVEFLIDLGGAVDRGAAIALIYPIGRTGVEPIEVRAKMDGVLVARHNPGLIKSGDCCAVLGVEVQI